jgi:hypothetical protein
MRRCVLDYPTNTGDNHILCFNEPVVYSMSVDVLARVYFRPTIPLFLKTEKMIL